MNREELRRYIMEEYHAENDFPWLRHPENEVFRHPGNRKWFALIMEVTGVVNLKCDPLLIGSLRAEPGFFPAYHMNKASWITAALDGSIPDDKLKMLLELSFEATAPGSRGR